MTAPFVKQRARPIGGTSLLAQAVSPTPERTAPSVRSGDLRRRVWLVRSGFRAGGWERA
jgi:hypothetical protein